MKLSDVVSALNVSVFAQVPLLVFFGIFIGVVLHLLQGKSQFEHARQLPLDAGNSDAERDQ